MSEPSARIEFVDGQVVTHDEDALGMIDVIDRHNRGILAQNHRPDIDRWLARLAAYDCAKYMIFVISVDDPVGSEIADILAPGYDWDTVRKNEGPPYARGIVEREPTQRMLDECFPSAGAELRAIGPKPAAMIVDSGLVFVVPA